MGSTLNELVQDVHVARAHCLHGDYSSSIATFARILEVLQKKLEEERRAPERAKWQGCIDELTGELLHVQNYENEKRNFRRVAAPEAASTSAASQEQRLPFGAQPFAGRPASPQTEANSTFASGLRGDGGRSDSKPRRSRVPTSNAWKGNQKSPSQKAASARDSSGIPPKPPVYKQPANRKGSNKAGGSAQYDAGGDDDLVDRLLKEVLDDAPGVKWDDIAGLHDAKLILREALELPQLAPDLFTGIRTPVRGVLLHGPPGTGKTLLAKAVATECNTTFFNISSSSLASKWKGDSEKLVRHLFGLARHHAPSTIFIDEMDSVCSKSDSSNEASLKVKTELLTQLHSINILASMRTYSTEHRYAFSKASVVSNVMTSAFGWHVNDDGCVQINGIQKGDNVPPPDKRVLLIGATNNPHSLDDAFIRRLEKRVYIPLPETPDRAELLKINCRGTDIADDVDLMDIAEKLHGYSGDDIRGLCREAAMIGLRRRMEGLTNDELKALNEEFKAGRLKEPIRLNDFLEACQRIRPSVREIDLAKHLKFQEEYRSV